MKTITVIAEDKLGLLADISYILAKGSINIESLNADLVGRKAIVSLMVRDGERARDILAKGGYKTAEAETLVVRLPNKVGEIEKLSERLSGGGVNMESLHMLSNGPSEGIFLIKVDDPKKAGGIISDLLVNQEY